MKRVRCPKCDYFITFDETLYDIGQSLVFQCPKCNKQFGIRIGTKSVLDKKQRTMYTDEKKSNSLPHDEPSVGCIVVIENVFHYKQTIPLYMGDNIIGRYQKGNPINCPIETVDPSIDMTHCTINVSRDKQGRLKYVLCDGPSYTGTFVDNEILADREQRVIADGTLFTIGATSIILKINDSD